MQPKGGKVNRLFNHLPTRVGRADFNRFVRPYLSRARRGPRGKVSSFKIFNYILYVLHTGIQWEKLPIFKNEIYWTNIYKWHNRWSKDGSYEKLFSQSILFLDRAGQLDLSILHGDGSNTVAKKGGKVLAIPDINSRKA